MVVANVADRIAVMYAGDIVEVGTCDEVFASPKHPYTWALLSSMPQLGVRGEPLYSIEGVPPNLFTEINGDAFAPRNRHALAIDFLERPLMFLIARWDYVRFYTNVYNENANSKIDLAERLKKLPLFYFGKRDLAGRQIGRRRVGKECRSRWSPYH